MKSNSKDLKKTAWKILHLIEKKFAQNFSYALFSPSLKTVYEQKPLYNFSQILLFVQYIAVVLFSAAAFDFAAREKRM